MKRKLILIAAAAAAASVAACNSQEPATQAPANAKSVAAPESSGKPAEALRVAAAPADASMTDHELSDKVRNALTSDRSMEIGGVEVAAADGVVTIYGTVDAPAEKNHAALVALGIDGVRSVVNRLVVIRGS